MKLNITAVQGHLTAFIVSIAILGSLSAYAEKTRSRYCLDVHDFTELKVTNGLNVDYVCSADSAGLAVFDTTDDLASIIMFSNNDKGTLRVELNTDGFKYHDLPTIRLYSSFLNKIENAGDSLVRVLTVAPCPEFNATVIGNGRLSVRDIHATTVNGKIKTGKGQLVINGKCTKANLHNTGTGSIQADGLEAAEVKCSIFGTGPIGCHATGALISQGMGSGKVYYRGPETLKIRSRGLGVKVIPIDGKE